MEKIVLIPEDGASPEEFYVLDTATLAGQNYLLVTDEEEGDGTALIFREVNAEDGSEAIYEIVEDDVELSAILKVFEELLEDVDIEM